MISKKANLSNSIYQRQGSKPGLTVKGGMLINNRPDSTTGIQQAVEMKKAIRIADKVEVMSKAIMLGNMKSEYYEDMD
jgi:hypothetical protein